MLQNQKLELKENYFQSECPERLTLNPNQNNINQAETITKRPHKYSKEEEKTYLYPDGMLFNSIKDENDFTYPKLNQNIQVKEIVQYNHSNQSVDNILFEPSNYKFLDDYSLKKDRVSEEYDLKKSTDDIKIAYHPTEKFSVGSNLSENMYVKDIILRPDNATHKRVKNIKKISSGDTVNMISSSDFEIGNRIRTEESPKRLYEIQESTYEESSKKRFRSNIFSQGRKESSESEESKESEEDLDEEVHYLMDEDGYLLTEDGEYLLDENNQRVKLSDNEIGYLKSVKLYEEEIIE